MKILPGPFIRRATFAALMMGPGASPSIAATLTFSNITDQDITKTSNWSGGTPTFGSSNANRWNINGITEYTAAQGTTMLTGDRGLLVGSIDGTTTTMTVSGGTINLWASTTSLIPLIGAGSSSSTNTATSELVINGGNLNALNAGGTANSEFGILARGTSTAKAILTISNGSILSADLVSFGTLEATTGTAIINLNQGGILKARAIYERNDVANTQINFNGGTLMANDTDNSEDWIRTTNGGPVVTIGTLGGTFDSNGQLGQKINTVIGGAGGVTIKDTLGTGAVVFTANNTYGGTTTINAGARLYLGSSGASGTVGNGAVTNNGSLIFNRTDTISQSQLNGLSLGLSGSGTFVKGNNGTLIADVANSHTGLTDISGGILQITNTSALGTTAGATQVRADGQLQLTGGITINGETLILAADGNAAGAGRYLGGLHSASGTNTWAGAVTLGTAARMGAQNDAVLRVSGKITGAGLDLIIRNGDTGITEFSGSGSSYANTRIYSGTLRLGATNGVATNSKLIVGAVDLAGTFDMNGYHQTVAGLGDGSAAATDQANETVTNNGSANSILTVNSTDTRAYSGTISDGATNNISLVKQGTGTLTLAGVNSYTGATTITAGTLALGASGSISNSSVITVNGTLDTSAKASFTVDGVQTLKGGGTINVGAGNTLNIGGTLAAGNSAGVITIDGGTTTFASGSIFAWELNDDVDSTTGTRGSNYDGLTTTNSGNLTVDSGAIFKVILTGSVDGGDAFWNTTRSWTDIFSVAGTTSLAGAGLFDTIQVVDGTTGSLFSPTNGSFTFTGSTLTWSAVPEPTNAFAGLLAAAGLMRRRRLS